MNPIFEGTVLINAVLVHIIDNTKISDCGMRLNDEPLLTLAVIHGIPQSRIMAAIARGGG